MKTPREILFARHQAAAPKLDAIRHEAVRQLNNQETKEQNWPASLVASFLGCSNKLWLELVWPCRRIWTGLAAVWVLIFIVNFSQRDGSQTVMEKSSPSPEMILVFRQQEKLLAELIGQNEPRVAEPPKTFSPRPSSERRFEILIT